jgi:NAD(P)-dependent dehydrogenase (short-subunit alcohol dehydrogenase family)
MATSLQRYDDRVILVTGGSGKMGSAVVRRLVGEGAKVAITDFDEESATLLAKAMNKDRDCALALPADLADLAQVRTVVDRTLETFGKIDGLCNAAGVGPRGKGLTTRGAEAWLGQMFWDVSPETWEPIIKSSLGTCMNCCYVVLPHMVERGYGRILNWVTGAVTSGRRGIAPYAAAKGGVFALTKALSKEAGPHGITVNDISFGEHGEWPAAYNEYFEPGVRGTEPEDVADVAAFLLSDDARWVSGHSICASGGQFPR